MSRNKEMKGRIFGRFSGLWLLAVLALCSPENYLIVEAEPEPLPPGLIYNDNYVDDAESFLLLQRLKQIVERKHEVIEQARELVDEQMEIQTMLEAEARRNRREFSTEDVEMLPIPSAVVHHGPVNSGKRTSYMSLCHFKICNMGRKRQL